MVAALNYSPSSSSATFRTSGPNVKPDSADRRHQAPCAVCLRLPGQLDRILFGMADLQRVREALIDNATNATGPVHGWQQTRPQEAAVSGSGLCPLPG
jgi:hypothetical protein